MTSAGTLLADETAALDHTVAKAVRESPGVTLSFDSWTNIRKEQLMALVLTLATVPRQVWKEVSLMSSMAR